ncbi:unnamed protein product, partial [Rotaria sp. Silwood1]
HEFNFYSIYYHFNNSFSFNSIQPRLSFKELLPVQFKQNKHHLIASCALVLLALPRLIISFISGCMKSPRNS